MRPFLIALAILVLTPVLVVNLAVAFFGSTAVFPLSPFFLEEKIDALRAYLLHRPRCWFDDHGDLSAEIRAAEVRHRLPPGLLGALVQVESETRPHRISFTGAMGPAQLMPGTARGLGVSDPFDPGESIDGGARYLAQQLTRYRNVRLALAAYNAGPGAVSTRVPKNGETERYVAKVLARCPKCESAPLARRARHAAPRRVPPLRTSRSTSSARLVEASSPARGLARGVRGLVAAAREPRLDGTAPAHRR